MISLIHSNLNKNDNKIDINKILKFMLRTITGRFSAICMKNDYTNNNQNMTENILLMT